MAERKLPAQGRGVAGIWQNKGVPFHTPPEVPRGYITLEACGAMTEYGRRKIEEAKKNGQWDNAASPSAISEEQIAAVAALLKENAQAYTNFQKMPASVKKTYTRAYLDAKTEAGRSRRLAWMMDRLENNLKPM